MDNIVHPRGAAPSPAHEGQASILTHAVALMERVPAAVPLPVLLTPQLASLRRFSRFQTTWAGGLDAR